MPSYPGRRYYGGCEQVDKIETIARERAKSLFGAEYVNVQPHSGAQANAASTRRSSSRATPCSVLPSIMADISPTA